MLEDISFSSLSIIPQVSQQIVFIGQLEGMREPVAAFLSEVAFVGYFARAEIQAAVDHPPLELNVAGRLGCRLLFDRRFLLPPCPIRYYSLDHLVVVALFDAEIIYHVGWSKYFVSRINSFHFFRAYFAFPFSNDGISFIFCLSDRRHRGTGGRLRYELASRHDGH